MSDATLIVDGSITATKIQAGEIKTSNYTEDAKGFAILGAKLDHTGEALKIGTDAAIFSSMSLEAHFAFSAIRGATPFGAPMPTAARWMSMAMCVPGTRGSLVDVRLCAMASGGAVATSDDGGKTWTARAAAAPTEYVFDGLNTTVGLGGSSGSGCQTSGDGGATWTSRTIPDTFNRKFGLYSGIGGAAKYVALGPTLGTYTISTDAITWAAAVSLGVTGGVAVAVAAARSGTYRERTVVAVNDATNNRPVMVWTDGWGVLNQVALPSPFRPRALFWSNFHQKFVLLVDQTLGTSCGKVFTSPDAVTWTETTAGVTDYPTFSVTGIGYNPGFAFGALIVWPLAMSVMVSGSLGRSWFKFSPVVGFRSGSGPATGAAGFYTDAFLLRHHFDDPDQYRSERVAFVADTTGKTAASTSACWVTPPMFDI
jgi:hypothetical protein